MTKLTKITKEDGSILWEAIMHSPPRPGKIRGAFFSERFLTPMEALQWLESMEESLKKGVKFKQKRAAYTQLTLKETLESLVSYNKKFSLDQILDLLGDKANCYVGRHPNVKIKGYATQNVRKRKKTSALEQMEQVTKILEI